MSTTSSPQWLRAIVKRQFQPAGAVAVRRAMCIVGRESQWRPWAVNSSSGAAGLFQILPSAHPQFNRGMLLDAAYNTWAAWRLSRGGRDWSPWAGGRWAC